MKAPLKTDKMGDDYYLTDASDRDVAKVFLRADAEAIQRIVNVHAELLMALTAQEIADANDRGEDIAGAMIELGEQERYMDGSDLQEWARELRRSAIAKATGE
jgi:hypothetical protein